MGLSSLVPPILSLLIEYELVACQSPSGPKSTTLLRICDPSGAVPWHWLLAHLAEVHYYTNTWTQEQNRGPVNTNRD